MLATRDASHHPSPEPCPFMTWISDWETGKTCHLGRAASEMMGYDFDN